MPYNFDQLLTPGRQASRPVEGFNRRATDSAEHKKAQRIEPKKNLVFGEDIWTSPVPERTAQGLQGLYAAFQDAQGRRFGLDADRLSKHLLLLGGIGSGKTNVFRFLLESLLKKQTAEDIVFIFDTKGDYYETFYQPYNPNHIVIGNGRKYAGQTCYWNVFGELEGADGIFSSEDEFTAKEIGKQLFEGRGSETQPFFGIAAADLVAKLLIDFERQARQSGDRSRLNNRDLTGWLKASSLERYIEMIRRNPDFSSAYLYFGDPAQGVKQKLTPQALAVFAYINAMCSDLLSGIFEKSDPDREFSMRRLVRDRGKNGGRTVVFIEYDLSVGEVLGPMYRLLIDLALKEALSQSGARQGSVVFAIDEFKLLPNLMHIDDALNFGRSLGIKVLAGLQSVSQIYAGYGEERGGAILSGFMNSFCFQTPDGTSRQYISRRFGGNCTHLHYRVLDEHMTFQREGHTVEDWDILSLGIGQAVVDLVGEPPFMFQFQDFERPHAVL